jgi:tetratricopeptide (TPR) repeat protein
MRRRSLANLADRLVLGLALTCALAAGGVLAGCGAHGVTHGPDDQVRFGVQMARQGLWSEALFRFDRARQMDPGNARVLNNIAVALEAAGRYEEALEAYREALQAAPGNRTLSENYARFLEFYEGFKPAEGVEGVTPPEAAQGEVDGEPEEPR